MTNHLIINGSCISVPYIPDGIVQLTVTSPPYGQIRDYSDDVEQIGNCSADLANEKLVEVFKEVYRITKDGGFLCLNIPNYVENTGDGYLYPAVYNLVQKLLEFGWKIYREVYWKKQGTYAKYGKHPYHFFVDVEPIIVFRKIEQKIIGEQGGTLNEVSRDYDKTSIWEINPVGEKEIHVATFPIELPNRCIKSYSKKDDIVYDPFLGSGTTSLSAKNLGRRSIGVELKKDYINVIKNKLGVDQKSVFGDDNKFWFVDRDVKQEHVKRFLETGEKTVVEDKDVGFKECKLCGGKSPPIPLDDDGVCELCGCKTDNS